MKQKQKNFNLHFNIRFKGKTKSNKRWGSKDIWDTLDI